MDMWFWYQAVENRNDTVRRPREGGAPNQSQPQLPPNGAKRAQKPGRALLAPERGQFLEQAGPSLKGVNRRFVVFGQQL